MVVMHGDNLQQRDNEYFSNEIYCIWVKSIEETLPALFDAEGLPY